MTVRVLYTGTRAPAPVEGAEVLHLPALTAQCLDVDFSDLHGKRMCLLVFSSNAWRCAVSRGLLRHVRVEFAVAVGEKTAESLRADGVLVDTPSTQDFDGVVHHVKHLALAQSFPWLALELASSPRDISTVLPEVDVRTVYATGASMLGYADAIACENADWVVFASPRAVDEAASALRAPSFRIAAIGETTAAHLRSLGVQVDFVPQTPDVETLIAQLVGLTQTG